MSALSFKKKKIVTQETLGEHLKKVRHGKNWTLEVASEKTNVNIRHLEALEKSRYDDIPGEVYITNFIRVYARALGLDPDKTIEKYKLERHIIHQKKHHHFLKDLSTFKLTHFFLKPSTIKVGMVCILVSVVLSYLAWNVYTTIAPPDLLIYSPDDNIETTALEIAVEGKTEMEVFVEIMGEEVLLNNEGQFAQTVILREGLNLIIITAKRKHGMERKITRHILVTNNEVAYNLK